MATNIALPLLLLPIKAHHLMSVCQVTKVKPIYQISIRTFQNDLIVLSIVRMETSQQLERRHPRHHSASRFESLTDVDQHKTEFVFIPPPNFPQSSNNNNPTPTMSEEDEEGSGEDSLF